MPATPKELFELLTSLGIEAETVEHEAVFSVAESQHLRGLIPGAHSKNLFLIDRKDRLFLVVAPEDAKIELKSLHHRIGASGRLSFGKPELLLETLGVTPGSVTPFAAINDREGRVSVVLDAELMKESPVNFHPLVNTMSTRLSPDALLRFFEATGHKPLIVALSAPEPA